MTHQRYFGQTCSAVCWIVKCFFCLPLWFVLHPAVANRPFKAPGWLYLGKKMSTLSILFSAISLWGRVLEGPFLRIWGFGTLPKGTRAVLWSYPGAFHLSDCWPGAWAPASNQGPISAAPAAGWGHRGATESFPKEQKSLQDQKKSLDLPPAVSDKL